MSISAVPGATSVRVTWPSLAQPSLKPLPARTSAQNSVTGAPVTLSVALTTSFAPGSQVSSTVTVDPPATVVTAASPAVVRPAAHWTRDPDSLVNETR